MRFAGGAGRSGALRTSLQAGLNGAAGRTGAMGILARMSDRIGLRKIDDRPWGSRDGEGCLNVARDFGAGCRWSGRCISRRRLDRVVLRAASHDLPIRRPWGQIGSMVVVMCAARS